MTNKVHNKINANIDHFFEIMFTYKIPIYNVYIHKSYVYTYKIII